MTYCIGGRRARARSLGLFTPPINRAIAIDNGTRPQDSPISAQLLDARRVFLAARVIYIYISREPSSRVESLYLHVDGEKRWLSFFRGVEGLFGRKEVGDLVFTRAKTTAYPSIIFHIFLR